MNNKGYAVRYLLPVAVWMIIIFVSSSIPQDDFPHVEFWGWAKLVHLIYYGVLCLLCQRALGGQTRFPALARHSYLLGVLFAVLYGTTDEYHQLTTAGRHGRMTDVLIDGFGALLCLVGLWAYRMFHPRAAGDPSGE